MFESRDKKKNDPKDVKAEKKRLKKLKKLEKKKNITRDTLDREINYGILNKKEVDKKWKKIALKLKHAEILIDFRTCVNHYNRALDAKDYLISLLRDELDEAHNQQQNNFKAHCEKIDEILGVYQLRIGDMKTDYENRIEDFKATLKQERHEFDLKEKENKDYINVLEFGIQKTKRKNDLDDKIRLFRWTEDFDIKSRNEIHIYTDTVYKKFTNIWNIAKEIFKKYEKETSLKRIKYKQIEKNDAVTVVAIKTQRQQLLLLFLKIKKIREKQTEEKQFYELKMKALGEQYNTYGGYFVTIRKGLVESEETDKAKLLVLVLRSNKILDKLTKVENLGERIVNMMSLIRKHETEKEKILPFPSMQPEQIPRILKSEFLQYIDTMGKKEMANFWQRVGQIDQIRHFLKEEQNLLDNKNKEIKTVICEIVNHKFYLTVPDCSQIRARIVKK